MKYCSKCGSANPDDSAYCPRCGSPLALAPAVNREPSAGFPAAPAQESAPAQETAPAQEPAPARAAAPETSNVSMLWMILNIAATVLCCPGFIFSVAGIVFAALGSESFGRGDAAGARKKSTVSMILFIVGVVVGLAGWIAAIAAIYLYGNGNGFNFGA